MKFINYGWVEADAAVEISRHRRRHQRPLLHYPLRSVCVTCSIASLSGACIFAARHDRGAGGCASCRRRAPPIVVVEAAAAVGAVVAGGIVSRCPSSRRRGAGRRPSSGQRAVGRGSRRGAGWACCSWLGWRLLLALSAGMGSTSAPLGVIRAAFSVRDGGEGARLVSTIRESDFSVQHRAALRELRDGFLTVEREALLLRRLGSRVQRVARRRMLRRDGGVEGRVTYVVRRFRWMAGCASFRPTERLSVLEEFNVWGVVFGFGVVTWDAMALAHTAMISASYFGPDREDPCERAIFSLTRDTVCAAVGRGGVLFINPLFFMLRASLDWAIFTAVLEWGVSVAFVHPVIANDGGRYDLCTELVRALASSSDVLSFSLRSRAFCSHFFD